MTAFEASKGNIIAAAEGLVRSASKKRDKRVGMNRATIEHPKMRLR